VVLEATTYHYYLLSSSVLGIEYESQFHAYSLYGKKPPTVQ